MARTRPCTYMQYITKSHKAQHRYCFMFSADLLSRDPQNDLKSYRRSLNQVVLTGHFRIFFQTSMFSMYLDTASVFHLRFSLNQLHFIACISVLRSFCHSFSCCNETFRHIWVHCMTPFCCYVCACSEVHTLRTITRSTSWP